MRSILRPAFSASSRHRCSSFSNALSSTASFFNGWRSTPGAIPATNRRAKPDRLDSELLKRALLGWLRGECDHCKMVAIPSIKDEDAERPNRERESLVGEQSRIVDRMKAALIRLGIRGFNPTLKKAAGRRHVWSVSSRRPVMDALRPVGRACSATAPPAPACRPSRYQPRSGAPMSASLAHPTRAGGSAGRSAGRKDLPVRAPGFDEA
jgi:transposase